MTKQKIFQLLPYFEKAFLAITAVGYINLLIGLNFPMILSIGLTGLAATFFLHAYKPLDLERPKDETSSLAELLGTTVIPKVLWMSASVSTVGIMFYTLDLPGYLNMLTIGGTSLLIGSIVLLLLKVSGTRYLEETALVLYRAIPIMLVVAFILLVSEQILG
ncbi:hypothetical protein [Reichenbachiella ulvae]|uniref:Uncharacterized protein n=1 Tax=Reichenbachiella ulvae TaxID=2980104 RepID=A0ABT3CUA3_9BACT|nr:hypothetical protein [Reichenbachiella ulvae]MCV9387139.1 hypothetical protein [Reichenbachiella ulvae]